MSVSDLVASISCYKNCLLIKLAKRETCKDSTSISWLSGSQWAKLINQLKAKSILWQELGKKSLECGKKHPIG